MKIIRSLLKAALNNQYILTSLNKISSGVKRQVIVQSAPETDIVEARPIDVRLSSYSSQRLNLLVPALSLEYVFGGISTALTLFDVLGQDMKDLRIILTDQVAFSADDNPNYKDWEICSLENSDGPGRKVIPAGYRVGQTLAISQNDRFIATAWWSSVIADQIQRWQLDNFPNTMIEKYVYLIQDYEPGFYPWSARYALAESTYHDTSNVIAVFNTGFLKNYFDAEGYYFEHEFTFEPTLHPKLRLEINSTKSIPKEKRILVYGRPGVDRNAFQLIIMSLRIWVARHPDTDWTFISAGETHNPIDLGCEKQLVSLGKLSLTNYANELAKASVGISLMISPHPSYPPLEMAAFGMKVVTNRYKGKNLSEFVDNIVSIDSLAPENIADTIDECVSDILCDKKNEKNHSELWKHYLNSTDSFAPIHSKIITKLFSQLN